MSRLLDAITHFAWIITLDALMSFIIFGSTTFYVCGPSCGTIAFWIGLILFYKPARDAVDGQRVGETVKQATGMNVVEGQLVRHTKAIVPSKPMPPSDTHPDTDNPDR